MVAVNGMAEGAVAVAVMDGSFGGKGGGDADSQRSHFHFPDIGSTVNCMTDVLLVECKKVATF